MATINSLDFVKSLIKADGYYGPDPRVRRITQYTTIFGNEAYGVDYYNNDGYQPSATVLNPIVLFDANETREQFIPIYENALRESIELAISLVSAAESTGKLPESSIKARTRILDAYMIRASRWVDIDK